MMYKIKAFVVKVLKFIIYPIYSLQLKFLGDYHYLFIVSHTRSGSSLLTNILISHADIIGYGETMNSYRDKNHFKKLIFDVHWKLRHLFLKRCKYVLDKKLHGSMYLDKDILGRSKFIFLLRKPEDALPSMYKTAQMVDSNSTYSQVLTYYLERLDYFHDLYQSLNGNTRLLVNYEELLSDSEVTLGKIQNFLGLSEKIAADYEVKRFTGKLFIGDWSENIKSGKILKNKKSTSEGIQFPDHLIVLGKKKYNIVSSKLNN